jgi:hypothetical protein
MRNSWPSWMDSKKGWFFFFGQNECLIDVLQVTVKGHISS